MKTRKQVLERLERFDGVGWLYKALQSEPRIAWLYMEYRPQECDTLKNYREVKSERRKTDFMGFIIFLLLGLGAWFTDHLISQTILSYLGPEGNGFNLVFHIVAGGSWMFFLIFPFIKMWADYIGSLTDERWKNQEFPKELESLVRFLFPNDSRQFIGKNWGKLLNKLASSGNDGFGSVPRHVQELAEVRLSQEASAIVFEKQNGGDSANSIFFISRKGKLKEKFELCRKFTLLQGNTELGHYYGRAEAKFKKKAKELVKN